MKFFSKIIVKFRMDGTAYNSLREEQKLTVSPSLRYPNYQSMPRNYGRSNSSNNIKGKPFLS